MRKIYDVSMNIEHNMQVYKDNEIKRPNLIVTSNFNEDGSGVRNSRINMDLHTGTHMDAPLHMIRNGQSIDNYAPENMVVEVKVIDLTTVNYSIKKKDLEVFNIKKGDFILLKTRNSLINEFGSGFVYLEKSGAQFLALKKIKGVGIDALGIERGQKAHDTHKILFEKGIIIIEGLRLANVAEGKYTMIAAPLKISGAEASPARVLLIEKERNQDEI